MSELYIEKRKRGFFGWVSFLIFIGWNILMLYWLVAGLVGSTARWPSGEAEQVGAAIGTGLGVTMVLFIWVIGAVVHLFASTFRRLVSYLTAVTAVEKSSSGCRVLELYESGILPERNRTID